MEVDEFQQLREVVPELTDQELDYRLRLLEAQQRELDAQRSVLLADAERRKLYRRDSHASMWGLLRANLGWSDVECRNRMRLARLGDRFPEVLESLVTGEIPVAHALEIARGFANPRVGEQIEAVLGQLLNEARTAEHDTIRERVRTWETATDMDGAHRNVGVNHEQRNAHVTEFAGISSVLANLAGLDGAEVKEIFERFVDAETDADWAAARERYGDKATKALLARTDAQRRADALVAIFRTAAAASNSTRWRKPVVNILIDQRTFEDYLTLIGLLPETHRNPFDDPDPLLRERVCRTANGTPVTPAEAFQAAVAGYIRFQIVNTAGQVVRQSRKQRLFTGAARDAVMQQAPRCTHPGCRIHRGLQADHLEPHSRGGPTNPANGGPACPRHNRDRYTRGYTVTRDTRGWHTYRPDGTEIGPLSEPTPPQRE